MKRRCFSTLTFSSEEFSPLFPRRAVAVLVSAPPCGVRWTNSAADDGQLSYRCFRLLRTLHSGPTAMKPRCFGCHPVVFGINGAGHAAGWCGTLCDLTRTSRYTCVRSVGRSAALLASHRWQDVPCRRCSCECSAPLPVFQPFASVSRFVVAWNGMAISGSRPVRFSVVHRRHVGGGYALERQMEQCEIQ